MRAFIFFLSLFIYSFIPKIEHKQKKSMTRTSESTTKNNTLNINDHMVLNVITWYLIKKRYIILFYWSLIMDYY